jgi:hypothetical protein
MEEGDLKEAKKEDFLPSDRKKAGSKIIHGFRKRAHDSKFSLWFS